MTGRLHKKLDAPDSKLVTQAGSDQQPFGATASSEQSWSALVVAAAAGALLLKLLIALKTYGTNDVYAWERFAVWSRYLGVAVYRELWDFNHPPFMITVIHSIEWLANLTHLPFPFWLRVPAIVADTCVVWIMYQTLRRRTRESSIRWAIVLLALAPPLILISGFHGNTDSVMICLLLVSLYLAENGSQTWAAGAVFGAAMSVKIVPLIIIPVVLFHYTSTRKRIEFLGAVAIVWAALCSPFLLQDPLAVLKQVFGYDSYFGHWGLSYLTDQTSHRFPWLEPASTTHEKYGTYFLAASTWALAFWMNRLSPKPRLFSQAGATFFLFLTLSNGFGVQYLAWLAPWVVELGVVPAALLYASSGVFLFLVYNFWSQGFPWYIADSDLVGDYQGRLDPFQLVCWMSVAGTLFLACNRMRTRVERTGTWTTGAVSLTLALSLALLVFCLTMPVRFTPEPKIRSDKTTLAFIQARSDLGLSAVLYKRGRYRDSIAVVQEALRGLPDSDIRFNVIRAEGQNTIAAGLSQLRMWDEAILAAREALRFNPDYDVARKNLAWLIAQRDFGRK